MPAKRATPYEALNRTGEWISQQLEMVGKDEVAFLAQISSSTEEVGQGLLHSRGDLIGLEVLSFLPLVHSCPRPLLSAFVLSYLTRIRTILSSLNARNRDGADFDFGVWGTQWYSLRRFFKAPPVGFKLVTGRWKLLGVDVLHIPGGGNRGGVRERAIFWLQWLDANSDDAPVFWRIDAVRGVPRNTKIWLDLRVADVFPATFWATQDGVLYPVESIDPETISYGPDPVLPGVRLAGFLNSLPICEKFLPGGGERLIILRDVVFGLMDDEPVLYDPHEGSGFLPLATSSFVDLAALANVPLLQAVLIWNGFYATLLQASTEHGPWLSTPKRVGWSRRLGPLLNGEAGALRDDSPREGRIRAVPVSESWPDAAPVDVRLKLARIVDLSGYYLWWRGVRAMTDLAGFSVCGEDLRGCRLVDSRPFSLVSERAWDRDYRMFTAALDIGAGYGVFITRYFVEIQKIRWLRFTNKKGAYDATRAVMQHPYPGDSYIPPTLFNAFHLGLAEDDYPLLQNLIEDVNEPHWRREVRIIISYCPGSPEYIARCRNASAILYIARMTLEDEPTTERKPDLFACFGGFTFNDLHQSWPLTKTTLARLAKKWPSLMKPLAMVALESDDISLAVKILEAAGACTWPDDARDVALHFLDWTKKKESEEIAQKFIESSYVPRKSTLGKFDHYKYIFSKPFSQDFSQRFLQSYVGNPSGDLEAMRRQFPMLLHNTAYAFLLFGDAVRPYLAGMNYGANRTTFTLIELAETLAKPTR
ncbi:hypothetical protein [Asaia spathodeae]